MPASLPAQDHQTLEFQVGWNIYCDLFGFTLLPGYARWWLIMLDDQTQQTHSEMLYGCMHADRFACMQ